MDIKKLRAMAEHPLRHQIIFLLKIGLPYDLIDVMPDDERTAWVIAVGLCEGHEFDWNSGRWSKQ